MIWKGVIIKESLLDKTILSLIKVVRSRETILENENERGTLTFLYIELEDERKEPFIRKVLASLIDRFYVHICKEERMIVIYKNKMFEFSSNEKDKLNQAREYGLSIGILREQMPFEELIKEPYS